MTLGLLNTQKCLVSILIEPAGSTVDAPPTWSLTTQGLVTLAPAEDGMSCVVSTVDGVEPGIVEVSVQADADLGEGVETIMASFWVEILPVRATGFGISFGTPEPK